MAERKGLVTFKSQPLTLVGRVPKLGHKAPDFSVCGTDLGPVKLSGFAGRMVVISAVPSLDTPTCDRETRRFNAEAGKFGDDVVVLTVSMDLPFAQKRWCQAADANRIVVGSDHRDADFAKKYGVLIQEWRLLARSLFVVDRKGKLQYQQLVREISQEPNYDEVLDVVAALLSAGKSASVPQPETVSIDTT